MARPRKPARKQFDPQEGPQTLFFNTVADIIIYGGAAGGGKTWALLAEAARHRKNPGFRGALFRRTTQQIENPGGLWDESGKIYRLFNATANETKHTWRFPSGAYLKFSHLQHEKHKEGWQGAQISLAEFDELTHFSESQFWYIQSRLRSLSGVRPYCRASTNPAPGWVRSFLAPWLEKDWDGPHGPANSGDVRYFLRVDGKIKWVEKGTKDKQGRRCMSVAFVRSSIEDNKILMQQDPDYISKLAALPEADRRRLLEGDWDVFEGQFWTEFSAHRHTILPPYAKGEPLPKDWRFFGGLDWGFRHEFAFVLRAWDPLTRCTHVIESVSKNRLSNEAQADQVRAVLSRWGVHPALCPISADRTMWNHKTLNAIQGEPDISAFLAAGLQCVPSTLRRLAGWSRIRSRLHAPNFTDGKSSEIRIWQGYNQKLIELFPLWIFKKDSEDMAKEEDCGIPDHLADALKCSEELAPDKPIEEAREGASRETQESDLWEPPALAGDDGGGQWYD